MIALTTLLSAQNTPPEASVLSLEQAIEEALVRNLALRIDRFDPLIAKDDVIIADATFDLVLTAEGSVRQVEDDVIRPNNAGEQTLATITSDDRSYSAGVRKRLGISNGTLSLTTALNRSDGSNFDFQESVFIGGNLRQRAQLTVALDQPLLRDFGGQIASADLEKARSDQRIARLQLRDTTLELIAAVETAYWSLAEAKSRRSLRETNRELAERLLEETIEREELGLLTALDVIQAEANLAQREEDILVADQQLDEATDSLLRLLGRMDESLAFSADLLVAELPDISAQSPEWAHVWRDALQSDFTSLRQQELVSQREIDLIVARNARKPELDLALSASVAGRSSETASAAYDALSDQQQEQWRVGLAFNYPLGQRAARAGSRNADRRLDQAELRLIELKQNLLQEVRSAWRELDTRKQRLRAAGLVLQLQQKTFEQERVKLDEGLSTLRDVLEIQRDLDNASLGLLAAQAAAIQAEVALERLRGSLLSRHGLSWSEISPELLK